MESFIGYIKTPQDALIIFEACRRGQLNRVQRRLSSKERVHISSGSVFAWDEREAGMRRWTDGRTWSPSRVLGSFLTYRELDTKRRPRLSSSSSTSSLPISSKASSSCSYKSDGLIKQSFSICTATNQKLHLISYYSKSDIIASRLKRPSSDPLLSKIVIPKGLYPELNPLDTSGGHSATVHNMRQDKVFQSLSPSLGHQSPIISQSVIVDGPSPSPPPSLSSSPCTSDEDLLSDLPSPTHSAYSTYLPYASQNLCSPFSSSQPLILPIQDIAWEKLPSSEDRRQLSALQGLVRL
ncbi:Gti1/Pac2 family-domain-containing protein [Spinellus fusiger]|nr:Gti1/Pac2 family-domain-containing protein [Spinellus fusiger]